jgi:two-component system chemotaxis response regulator CheY
LSAERTPLVYIVDDEESFNKLLTLVLGKYGIKSETFLSSEAVLKKAKIHPPDLCIIDLNLGPTEKGYDLIASLRKLGNPNMPIIICSSDRERQVISHALEMGASDFLIKPLDREVLTAKLLQFVKTAELGFSQPSAAGSVPQTEIDTVLNLNLKLHQIEEDGIILLSKHLILKGSVVTLSGDIIKEISEKEKPIMATVVSSELTPGDENYTIYLEFDPTDFHTIGRVRSWLSKRWKKSAPAKAEPKPV